MILASLSAKAWLAVSYFFCVDFFSTQMYADTKYFCACLFPPRQKKIS